MDDAGHSDIEPLGNGKDATDTLVVLDGGGKFVRSFGRADYRGGHGIDVRKDYPKKPGVNRPESARGRRDAS